MDATFENAKAHPNFPDSATAYLLNRIFTSSCSRWSLGQVWWKLLVGLYSPRELRSNCWSIAIFVIYENKAVLASFGTIKYCTETFVLDVLILIYQLLTLGLAYSRHDLWSYASTDFVFYFKKGLTYVCISVPVCFYTWQFRPQIRQNCGVCQWSYAWFCTLSVGAYHSWIEFWIIGRD